MTADVNQRAIIAFGDVEQLREARRIIRQEADTLSRVADSLDPNFCDAIRAIRSTPGAVIVTGVGKAGLIGRKLVATFASTGTRAHFLHPTEALHGDLGSVGRDDIMLMLSNSGESEELLNVLPAVRRRRISIIAVTRNDSSTLARKADIVIRFGKHDEAGELGLAPSCSTVAMLAVGDALALVLSQAQGFTSEDFADCHPAGSLGRQLSPVREVMRTGSQLRIAMEHETIRDVLVAQSRPGRRTGAVMLTNASGRLTGLFTDSDLARLFEGHREAELDQPIAHAMTCNPITVGSDMRLTDAIHLMSARKLSELPVVDALRRPIGMLDITDVLHTVESQEPAVGTPGEPRSNVA